MTEEQRIKTCLLIEKMHEQKQYSERLGLENRSRFHGTNIKESEEHKIC